MAESVVTRGNLVDEWMQGNVKVKVFDDAYIGKTPGEIQKTLERLTQTCWRCVDAARAAGKNI